MTITINFGGNGGIYTSFTRKAWRVCLGYVALTVYWFDLDDVLVELDKENQRLREDTKHLISELHIANETGINLMERMEE